MWGGDARGASGGGGTSASGAGGGWLGVGRVLACGGSLGIGRPSWWAAGAAPPLSAAGSRPGGTPASSRIIVVMSVHDTSDPAGPVKVRGDGHAAAAALVEMPQIGPQVHRRYLQAPAVEHDPPLRGRGAFLLVAGASARRYHRLPPPQGIRMVIGAVTFMAFTAAGRKRV